MENTIENAKKFFTENNNKGKYFDSVFQIMVAYTSAVTPAGNSWISVKDGLPELELPIIAFGEDGMRLCRLVTYHINSPGYAEGKRDQWFEYIEKNTCFHYYSVTHWQPLPEPPSIEYLKEQPIETKE